SNSIKFSVVSESNSPAKTTIQTRGFQLVVDEPESLGGTNTAPNPVEYILAGYAGCINVVAHVIAKELAFTPTDLSIAIEGEINPNRLLGRDFTERAGYKGLQVKVQTSAPLSQALKNQWLREIENRCPVNDNLSNPTPIDFQIV